MVWFFIFFLISGFCSLLYEVLWLRLAMAQFGVTTALTSIVISMFMAGLGLGSWGSGRLIRKYNSRIRTPAFRLYALAELLIGMSALLVPYQLLWGRTLLERMAVSASAAYYLGSGVCLALTLIPWCACMGATIPLGLLALSAMLLSLGRAAQKSNSPDFASRQAATPTHGTAKPLVLLFLTGLTSLGMEVVWIRQFTPYLGTVVYAFASILAAYLVSTFIGLQVYRLWCRKNRQEGRLIWVLLGLFGLLPLIASNPGVNLTGLYRLAGIAPFSGILGFLTPLLVDRWSGGDPAKAGKAYAVNVVGCIAGPLLSGFLLLPAISERWVLFLFSLPWLLIGVRPEWVREGAKPRLDWQAGVSYAVVLLALTLVFTQSSYEDQFAHSEVLRDNTATVVATGEGFDKRLLVNGVGMTGLNSITKFMAHMPLAFLDHPPQNAWVVCFGMGTTFRSLLSWGIPATAVELVPSVPKLFGYYHPDGPQLLRSPLSRVVIDDGRRYLERTSGQYDVITIDPPPPVQAAGSSLLYSKEFYAIIQRRLRPGGILQQWLPNGDAVVRASIARAVMESFPHVRVFRSVQGWGWHFLASNQPLPQRTAAELAGRLPANAARDLVEWDPDRTPEDEFADVMKKEVSLDQMIAEAARASALTDDRPENEYYALRSHFAEPKR